MKSIDNRARQVFHLFLGTVFLQGANIVTYILLARWLGVVQYGFYRQLFLIHQICISIFFSAFPSALLYFCGRQTPEGRGIVVRRQLAMVLVIGFGSSLLLRYGNSLIASCLGSPKIGELLQYFACFPAAYMVYSLVSPALVSYGRTTIAAVFSFFLACVNSLPVLLMAGYGFELKWIVATATAGAWVGGIAAIAIILVLTHGQRSDLLPPSFTEMAAYMGPLLLASGISIVGLRMDHLLVSHGLGPEVYGIYAAGALEIPFFSMLNGSVSSVLLPQFSILAKDCKWAEIRRVYQKALVHSAAIVFPVAAVLLVLAEPFVIILYGDHYRPAVPIFQIYLLFAPLRIAFFSLVLRSSGRTRPDFYGAVLYLILVTALVYTGIKLLGIVGAAISVLVATIILAGFLTYHTKKLTKGAIGFLELYPFSVLVAFPCIGCTVWFILYIITRACTLPPWALLTFGMSISAVMITAGLWLCRNTTFWEKSQPSE